MKKGKNLFNIIKSSSRVEYIGGVKRNCYLPLEIVNPLRTKTTKIVKEASVLATTFVLPTAAMKRKRDRAI